MQERGDIFPSDFWALLTGDCVDARNYVDAFDLIMDCCSNGQLFDNGRNWIATRKMHILTHDGAQVLFTEGEIFMPTVLIDHIQCLLNKNAKI